MLKHSKLILLFAFTSFILFACNNSGSGKGETKEVAKEENKTTAIADTSKKSIPSETSKWLGNTNIKINYHSPGVRGRIIWGGLVPFDNVWVTGAHKATTLEIEKDFIVGEKKIPAGKYALFTIPGKEEWTVIINKNHNQHLADDYDIKDDVVRIKVKPEILKENQERLKYEIDQTGERMANIIISWEKLSVKFGLMIKD